MAYASFAEIVRRRRPCSRGFLRRWVEQRRAILCCPKPHLSPGFVDKYGDGIRKVQASVVGLHR